jgi:alkyl hydroperoxide reductase subunit F
MLLDDNLRTQLKDYLALMEGEVVLKVSLGDDRDSRHVEELVQELLRASPRIKAEYVTLPRTPSFQVDRPLECTGVTFAGVPMGHEFASLVLAILQVSGRAPKASAKTVQEICKLRGVYNFEVFVSLSCHNCPEVVQALNLMSVLNEGISTVTINGAVFAAEAEQRQVMAVPTVFLNGEHFASGRMELEEILAKLGAKQALPKELTDTPYDVLVVGGGPAGVAAAIYAARKNLRTAMVADRLGGQVKDTLGIENFIGMPYTEGPKLALGLEEHIKAYNIDVLTGLSAHKLSREALLELELADGARLKSKTVVLATGAQWRSLNIPGEKEFKNKGIAYCPHCDGPLFKGKNVAVIGGGNSGVEAAIDLACVAKHVTVLEFMPELKADAVLQKRLYSLANVTVLKNVKTTEITGADKVNGLTYMERDTNRTKQLAVDGVFILIGLVPNTAWLKDTLERNWMGEIVVDKHGATSLPGVFAAGDCTDTAYKQIVIAMGSGATAALGAFDYLMKLEA